MKELQNTVLKYINGLFKKDNSKGKAIQTRLLPTELESYARQVSTPIQRYTKSELARLYNRRVPTLMSWINNNKDLIRELEGRGYKKSSKESKKEHVLLIFAYLGEP